MRRTAAIAAGLCLGLAACSQGDEVSKVVPREPGPDATGFYCSMALSEHSGPKGQIHLNGIADPFWFSSVRDALVYVGEDLASEGDIAGFWVNDMTGGSGATPAPGSWIDARTAWFVLDSTREAAMGGNEAIPFKERDAAERFAEVEGGRVADYDTARRAMMPAAVQEGGA